jgi:hypothetical protein
MKSTVSSPSRKNQKIEQGFKNKLLQKIAAFSGKTVEFKMLITLILGFRFG